MLHFCFSNLKWCQENMSEEEEERRGSCGVVELHPGEYKRGRETRSGSHSGHWRALSPLESQYYVLCAAQEKRANFAPINGRIVLRWKWLEDKAPIAASREERVKSAGSLPRHADRHWGKNFLRWKRRTFFSLLFAHSTDGRQTLESARQGLNNSRRSSFLN